MSGAIIKITGFSDYITSYLLTYDDVVVVETEGLVKDAPTIALHLTVPTGQREVYVEKIIDGKLLGFQYVPKVIAVQHPIQITKKMEEFVQKGGVIIIFEYSRKPSIDIIKV